MMDIKKAILVVSFGTSYNDNREKTIGAIERQIQEVYPGWTVRRAFTSRMIIRKLKERDGLIIDYITEAMERLVSDGFEEVVVQPTHIMNGIEYDDVVRIVSGYRDRIPKLSVGRPLLTASEDYDDLIGALDRALVPILDDDEMLVLMGHGSEHYANATYSQLQLKLWLSGVRNIIVTTVEGFPDFDDALAEIAALGYTKLVLTPLMVVAGDHANEDMAGDDDESLKSVLESKGYGVRCIIRGMGEYSEFRDLFVKHVGDCIVGDR